MFYCGGIYITPDYYVECCRCPLSKISATLLACNKQHPLTKVMLSLFIKKHGTNALHNIGLNVNNVFPKPS